ncbi:hypothetical protein P4C99_09285 [Pontiellaceae bacterium B1224]|nr:hypothetical protein [Pontiellaceae bacterium B1224]
MQILKEPLLHFILIGALLFNTYGFLNRERAPGNRIKVTAEKIEQLANTFSNDWNRAASAEELELLIDEYIREELAYREGLALGLDLDDVVLRERLRQKLEVAIEERNLTELPSDTVLQNYLETHGDLFLDPEDSSPVLPTLDEVRNIVIYEWENQQRRDRLESYYAELYEKYQVTVEGEDQ